jgi:DNA polymerase-3 subunit beta
MTTIETHDALPAETTLVERFLHALAHSGNPAFEAIARAVKEAEKAEADVESPCEMKFSLRQDVLLNALELVIKATSQRSILPVLGHFLMVTRPSQIEHVPAQVIFSGTNLETGISLQVDALVEREGAFTIDAKLLLNCIKTFPKGQMVTIEVQEPRVLVSCGKREFSLKGGFDASEFPHLWNEMVLGKGAPYVMGSDVLRQAISEVQFAAADDDSRPVFTAICVHVQEESVDLVAADSFRLALRTVPLPKKIEGRDATILVPVSSMRLLAKVMPPDVPVIVAWDTDRARAVFQAGTVSVLTRLVEGSFPAYTAALPKTSATTFQLGRKDLEQILAAFKPIASDSSNILKLAYSTSGLLAFHAESEDLGDVDDAVETTVEGPDGQIIFNARYLADVRKFVSTESFTFFLSGEQHPGLVVPTGRKDYSFVLMPMSLNR